MFQTIAARLGLVASHTPVPVSPVTKPEAEVEHEFGGFEVFGRSGLDLGGLHRDQQWVGAWGGRC